jgi:hypothetical protein
MKREDVGPTYYPIDPGTGLATGGVPTGAFHAQNKDHSSWKCLFFAQMNDFNAAAR